MTKVLFLFPPFWDIMNIHIAYPLLSAQLKVNGYNSRVVDLNIKFLNDILQKDFLLKALSKIKKDWKNFSIGNFNKEDKFQNARFNELQYFIKNDFDKSLKIPYEIEENIKIIKNEEFEDDNQKFKQSLDNIYNAINIVFLYYSKFAIHLQKEMMSYNDVKNLVLSPKYNLFLEYYKDKVELITQSEDAVCINISYSAQIIPALTIAYLIKKQNKSKIILGGTYITRIYADIIKYSEFFDIFADFISYGEGEASIVQFAKYLNNELSIDNVSGLIYKQNDKVIVNKQGKNIHISKIAKPDFSDLDFQDYFVKNKVLPLQTQRGCYWRKCSFCDISNGMNYCVKTVDKLIAELKYNKNVYGVSDYCIIDESMPPALLDKFSSAVIANGLTIKFSILSRLEKTYNYKILKNAYNAGLERIYWGIESANKRISKLMNKGIELNTMKKVLKFSFDAGIKNAVFVIFNFPTETYKEALDTVNFLSENKKYIDIVILYEYRLSKHSKIAKEPKKYGITILEEQKEFSTIYDFQAKLLTSEEKNEISKMINGLHLSSEVN